MQAIDAETGDVVVSSAAVNKIMKLEKTHCKPATLIMMPGIIIGVLLLTLFKGSSRIDSIVGVESCSAIDFVLLVVLIAFMVGMTVMNIIRKSLDTSSNIDFTTIVIKKEYKVKAEEGYKFAPSDLKWTPKLLTQFMIAAIAAGLVAGIFGLGGGVIFNPLLLSFKLPPAVSSATGMYMIMLTSFTNSIMFLLSGFLDVSYGFWGGAWVVVGTAIGIKIVNKLVKDSGRASYIAILLTFVIIFSAIVIPIYGTISLIQDSDGAFSFGSYC